MLVKISSVCVLLVYLSVKASSAVYHSVLSDTIRPANVSSKMFHILFPSL